MTAFGFELEEVEFADNTKATAFEPRIYTLLRQQPASCPMAPAGGDGKELLLAGHHDLPAELQDRGTPLHRAEEVDDFYIKIEFNKVRLMRGWARGILNWWDLGLFEELMV